MSTKNHSVVTSKDRFDTANIPVLYNCSFDSSMNVISLLIICDVVVIFASKIDC